jgi:hypothetical protein
MTGAAIDRASQSRDAQSTSTERTNDMTSTTATPNLTKQLLDALKAAGVKTTTSGKRGIAVEGKTIASVYDAAKGAIRLFVTPKSDLPATLAKPFTKTQTRGYAALIKPDADLAFAVDAIAFAATTIDAPKSDAPKSTSKSKSASSKSKSASSKSKSAASKSKSATSKSKSASSKSKSAASKSAAAKPAVVVDLDALLTSAEKPAVEPTSAA